MSKFPRKSTLAFVFVSLVLPMGKAFAQSTTKPAPAPTTTTGTTPQPLTIIGSDPVPIQIPHRA